MRGQGDQVGVIGKRDRGGHLRRIDQQPATRRMDDRGDLRDRLAHASLAIGPLHADEGRLRARQRRLQRVAVDDAIGADRNHRRGFRAGAHHRIMLDRGDQAARYRRAAERDRQ